MKALDGIDIYLLVGAIIMAFFESYHTERRAPLWQWYLAIAMWPILVLGLPFLVWASFRRALRASQKDRP